MPYILLRRSDLPAGLFQTLGILPNTSQRNLTLKPVGQTGYRNAPVNDVPVVTGGVFAAAATGLTAYLMSNVSSGAGVKATALMATVTFANLVSGDNFTISDGALTVNFVFAKTAAFAVAPTSVRVDVVGDVSAADVRDSVIAAVNASILDVTATNTGAAEVTLTNDNQNIAIALQNNTANAEAVANVGFTLADFAGATASDSLTSAEAIDSAGDILALLAAGSALTQAGINAMTTGNVTKAQVADILDILAGRVYVVPAAADVEVGGAFIAGLGAFDDTAGGIRRIYDTESLRISYGEGQLALARGSTFTYGGVSGAAVEVYEDDGSLYTP